MPAYSWRSHIFAVRRTAKVILAVVVAAGLLAAAAVAAIQPKVENPHGKFKGDCALCHGAAGWKPEKISPAFNHAAFGFPLSGAHSAAKCMACHSSLDFTQGKQLCASCHQDPHRGEMGTDCARCHSARSFTDRSGMVRQHQSTRFPLTGSHAQIDCEGCHKPSAQGKMQFVGTKAECQNCHMDAYKSTTNPNHVQSGFPLDCASCHSTLTWGTKSFDHDKTAFPLTGAHRTTACQSCHGDNVFKGKTTDCYGCHKADYDGTNNPAHSAAGFPTACASCHTTASWGSLSGGGTGTFNHNTMTAFPLTGAHTSAQCSQCHGDGVYKGKSTQCYSCHQTDYSGTADPKHSAAATTFVQACESCHTTVAWTGVAFDHTAGTTFPLTGAHIALDCNQCHGDNLYKGKSALCYSCHQADFVSTTNPPHQASGFPTNCESCHGTANWTSSTFNHNTSTKFALSGAHVGVACNQCHGDGVFAGKSMLCYSCHADKYATPIVNHTAAVFATTCQNCHTTAAWNPGAFNHTTQTTFPLTGAHPAVACNQCHGDNAFKGKSTLCVGCHKTDYDATTTPAHLSAGIPTNCESCHTTTDWGTGTFNHNTQTTFPLTGAHVGLACAGCHGDGVYKGKSVLCYSCHADKYATPVVNHAAAVFATTCENCHTTAAWNPGTFNHTTQTTFPLTGAHPAVTCSGCHGDNVFKGKSALCASCHKSDYDATTNPPHLSAGFPTACETCHTTTVWTTATFNHNTQTTFPLTGAHPAVACNGCHGDGVYKGKSVLCYSCHADKYATPVLNHTAAVLATTCENCHTTTAWNPGTFNHTTQTTFPLTGAHPAVACNQCHGDNVFKGKSTLCYSCHQSDYSGTTNPAHQASGFPTNCESCHSTTNWTSSTFNHNTSTTFPLTGAHVAVACNGCHGDNVFKGKSVLCYSCHADKFATPVLNHAAAAFATTCENCHTTTAWNPGAFNHSTQTTFPLTGAHPAVVCSGCHGDNVFKGKSTLCYSCHQTDYTGTNAPPHAASSIPTNCESCHTTADWGSGTFNHNTSTTFPLSGAHIAVACSGCHGDGVYKGKSTLCYSCHTADYTGTTDPKHSAAAFATTCETCHGTTNWTSATFNHTTQTTFPLTGAHLALDCNGCHGDNLFKGKSVLCYSCHKTEYTGTTNPPHAASGFPTNCETCHSTTNWTSATFNHNTQTTFPLTGAHQAVACNGCHGDNVYKGKSTLCYSCHQSDYTGTTTPAHQSAGFPTNCETCHSTTNWTSSTFNHNTSTTFPLTGAHQAVACNGCHGDNVYKGKSTLCYSCHKSDYDGTTDPKHGAAAATFVTTCETCHNTTTWTTATFNHTTQTTFPLTGAHITVDCNGCHGDNVYKGKSTLCYSCHKTEYNTTVVNHTSAGFGTACETCHTTTAWSGGKYTAHDTRFPIYSGRHLGKWSACTDCHTSTTNYAVFACYGSCHNVTSVDRQHTGKNGYVQGAADSNKCYSCHPKGSAG